MTSSAIIVYSLRLPPFNHSLQNPPNSPQIKSISIPTIPMAEEEFQESEVIFPDDFDSRSPSRRESRNRGKRRRLTASVAKISSVPVSIPVSAARIECFNCAEAEYDYGGGGEMVPPHVIVGRRVAGKMMALSICTGKGRVVKGRDLREFRNLVLRVTGFLET